MNYKSEKILIGHKLKKLRLNLNISQTDMASEIGISSSYLNLLENNQRPVTVQLLFRLSQAYNIDLKELSDDESEKLTAELSEVFADPIFNSNNISKRDIKQLATTSPSIAQSITELYSAYSKSREALQTNNTNLEMKSSPLFNVREFLENSGNHFPILEQAAMDLRKDIKLDNSSIFSDLSKYLEKHFNVVTQIIPQSIMGSLLRRNDPHRNRVLLSELLREPQRIFQIAIQIGLIAFEREINKIIKLVIVLA